jgi:hypothetical protein
MRTLVVIDELETKCVTDAMKMRRFWTNCELKFEANELTWALKQARIQVWKHVWMQELEKTVGDEEKPKEMTNQSLVEVANAWVNVWEMKNW